MVSFSSFPALDYLYAIAVENAIATEIGFLLTHHRWNGL